ncbi:MAG TPA: hypothetical protein VHL80_09355, partial [Polyangia bacterium]|nr:hypothetical protein [Polyangia bacterium]
MTTHENVARSVVWLAAVGAVTFLGACGASTPATPGGKAGAGGKAGSSATGAAGSAGGAAGSPGAAGETGAGGGSAGAAGDTTGAAGAQPTFVDTSGGMVSAGGVTLTIPAGALAATTPITVAPTTYTPPGYALASMVYDFEPSGTTFAQPVKVEIPLAAPMPAAHLFWSNAAGGFDDIGGTVVGATITGMVTHFSSGFAAVAVVTGHDGGAGAAGADAGASGSGGGG